MPMSRRRRTVNLNPEDALKNTQVYVKSVLQSHKDHLVLFLGKSTFPSVDMAKLEGFSRAVGGVPLPVHPVSRNVGRSLPLASRVCALTLVAAQVAAESRQTQSSNDKHLGSESRFKQDVKTVTHRFNSDLTPRRTLLRARELLGLSTEAHLVIGIMELEKFLPSARSQGSRKPSSPSLVLDEIEDAVGLEWRRDPNVTVVYFGDRIERCIGSRSSFGRPWIFLL